MNKNGLTLLGCSGSLALLLATAGMGTAETVTPAQAIASEDPVDITFAAPSKASPAQTLVQPQSANVDAASDAIGDLAIAKFRCDCNPCRLAVVQLLQTGRLSL